MENLLKELSISLFTSVQAHFIGKSTSKGAGHYVDSGGEWRLPSYARALDKPCSVIETYFSIFIKIHVTCQNVKPI